MADSRDDDMELESEEEVEVQEEPVPTASNYIQSNTYDEGVRRIIEFGFDLCKNLPKDAAVQLCVEMDPPGSTQDCPFAKPCVGKIEVKGNTLVAAEALLKGALVGEYCGNIVNKAAASERFNTYVMEGKEPRMVMLSHDRVMDATEVGSMVARHARHSLTPTTVMKRWIVQGETRIGLFALDNIAIEQEINYNHNDAFKGAVVDKNNMRLGELTVRQHQGPLRLAHIGTVLRCLADASSATEARACLDALRRTTDKHALKTFWEWGGGLVMWHVIGAKDVSVLSMAFELLLDHLPVPRSDLPGVDNLRQSIEKLTEHETTAIASAARDTINMYTNPVQYKATKRQAEEAKKAAKRHRHSSVQGVSRRTGPEKVNSSTSEANSTKSPAVVPPLPTGWKCAKDGQGRTYYYHQVTRKPQWNPPTVDPEPLKPMGSLPGSGASLLIGNQCIEIPPPTDQLSPANSNDPGCLTSSFGYKTSRFGPPREAATAFDYVLQRQSNPLSPSKLPSKSQYGSHPSFNSIGKSSWSDSQVTNEELPPSSPAFPQPPSDEDTANEHEVTVSKRSSSIASKKDEKDDSSKKDKKKVDTESKEKAEFRAKLSQIVVKEMAPYRKSTCTKARITSKEDFKHCARK
eukprot:Ihof_evm2s239 gene=Ihof_evmTU2s239